MTNKYLEKVATLIETSLVGGAAGAAAAPKGHRGSGVIPGVAAGWGGSIVGAGLGSRFGRKGVMAGALVGSGAAGAWAGHHYGHKAKQEADDKRDLEEYRRLKAQNNHE